MCLYYHPDATSLAVAGRGGAWLWHWKGEDVSEVSLTNRECREIQFSPDGQQLAMIDAGGQLWVRFVADAREQLLGPAIRGIAFSPDGSQIAAFGESVTTIWNTVDRRVVATIPSIANHLRFTPDGRTLVTAGPEIHLWQTGTGRELLNLGSYSPGGVTTVAVSPNGTQLAVGGGYRDEHAGVWIWQAPEVSSSTSDAMKK